jgi:amino acid adenylation domain-containing protein
MNYTSGSTGTPKGVALSHRNVLSAHAGRAVYGAPPESLLLPVSFAFDVFLSFTAWTLCEGGRLVIPTGARGTDLDELATLLRTQRVTHLVMLHHVHRALLAREDVRRANHLVLGIVGAESCPRELARDYRELTNGRLVNEYGPTEASWGTYHVADGVEGAGEPEGKLPIGRPPANYRAYLLDSELNPAPIGVPAELYIGGPGVARGYPGDPTLTAERFVPDPFGRDGGRLYRTGDLARMRPDGEIEFLGRRDQQVKIRGFRIEIGEVEAALSRYPGVGDVVVCHLPEQQQLTAYVTAAGASLDHERLREHMQRLLPEPMVPSAFVKLDALPVTPNGKVDRAALVAMGVPDVRVEEQALPRTPAEQAVAAIWCEVLEKDSIDVNADFFEIGGQSLLAANVISRLRAQFPVPLGLRDLFNAPTVAGLAELIGTRALEALKTQFGELSPEPAVEPPSTTAHPPEEEPPAAADDSARGDDIPLVAVPREGRLPLSTGQRQLWLVDRREDGSAAYQAPIAVRLDGRIDRDALRQALTEIVGRHEILRTRIDLIGEEPEQLIDPPRAVDLPLVEASAGELEDLLREAAARPIDLARDLMLRPLLFRLAPERHVLLVIIHHIAFDARSIAVFFEELDEFYTAIKAGRPARLSPLPLQYADYALWQHARADGPAQAAQLAHWRTRLSGLETPEIPVDHGSRTERDGRGRCLEFRVDAGLGREIRSFARQAGATASMVLLAAFKALLSRYSGSTDISVGTPVTGRDRHELDSLLGYFGNTLVMRTDLSGGPSFTGLVQSVRRATLDGLLNREVSLARITEELAGERRSSAPLFTVLFAHDTVRKAVPKLGDLAVTVVKAPVQWAQFDLTLRLEDQHDGSVAGELDYATCLFAPSTADRISRQFVRLLRLAVRSPEQAVTALPLPDAEERHQMLSAWNDNDAPRPDECLHRLVERQAAATPGAGAVEMGDTRLSYAELDARADALARHLRDLGVGLDDVVAVCLPRCLDLPVALLAVLKAGAAYLPLDPGHPAGRLTTVIDRAGARILLSSPDVAGTFADRLNGVVTVDAARFTPGTRRPLPSRSPDDTAYVIFTSGSTGEPKGVLVPHRGIVNRILWSVNRHGLTSTDRVLQKTTPAFDAAVWEFFAPLVSGGTVVLATPGAERDPAMMIADIIRHEVTVLQGVPSLLRLLAEEPRLRDCRSLRLVFSAGEPLTTALAEKLTSGLRAELHNTYGPTECSIDVTAFPYRRGGVRSALVPIGVPIDNTRIRLVDEEFRLVPVGVPGELCVSGDGLAHGYLNRPDLTVANFVPDPYASAPGARMYRTGDRARWRDDGTLEFLGRLDDQVKISGVRVEPAEIEAVLTAHPVVTEAVVAPWTDPHGDVRLVGYVVGHEPSSEEILGHAAQRLPGQLVPAAIVFLDTLPRTPSGKIARNGLPAPRFESGPESPAGAPRSPIEQAVADIWRAVLGLSRADLNTDFFSVGGHSLAAIRLMVRLREHFAIDLPVSLLYETRTIARLAARIAGISATGQTSGGTGFLPLRRAEPGESRPLSYAQEGLWLAEQVEPGSYLAPVTLAVDGPLDENALRATLTALTARHEILRTRYVAADGETCQMVDPPAPVELVVTDVSGDPNAREAALSMVDRFTRRPFDLEREAPLRACLIRLSPSAHVLVLLTHHIACDGWSLDFLARDLHELYGAHTEAREPELAPLPAQFGDYAAWQRGCPPDEHLEYWRERLAATAPLELPADRPRPAVRSSAGAAHRFVIPAPLARAVVEAGEEHQATPFITFLAVFTAFLSGYTDGSAVTVATPIAGRDRSEVEELVGCFINTLLMSVDVTGDPTFTDLIGRVRDTALGAYDRQAPFERLIHELAVERDPARLPFTEVMFRLGDVARTPFTLPGLQVRPFETRARSATFDLSLTLLERADGAYEGDVEYATALFDEATIAEFAGCLLRLLETVAADPRTPLSAMDPDPIRYDAILTAPFQGVPQAVAEHAGETPAAPAVIHDTRVLDYAELERMCGRIRARLAGLGVRRGDVVAVCLERGAEAAAALLGVLGAAAVYVPFDPNHPRARLEGMLEELDISVVITNQRHTGRFPGSAVIAVESLDDGPVAPVTPVTAEDIAYVIYTSGSTGRPKGVVVDHRAFSHHCAIVTDWYELDSRDRWAVMASLTFDASLDQIAAALTVGAASVVVDPATTDPERLVDELARHQVTIIDVTPAYYRAMIETLPPDDSRLSRLKVMSVGGDRVTYTDACRWADTGMPGRFEVGYGPTEATVTTTLHPVEPAELATARRDATIPIGRPLPGTPAYVLDENLRPVRPGAVGELYIGGIRIALGYHRRPELTADRFVPDPFVGHPGMRMYRSGDLVRRRANGMLDFVGRADNQVKIRGFRVELGEIESTLATHPAVGTAVVVSGELRPGERRLAAYIVPDPPEEPPSARELIRHLREQLPEYMVPLTWEFLPRLPITRNGKIDQAALPAPDWTRTELSRDETAPSSTAEKVICEIWMDALGLDNVGVHTDFFEVGANSMHAIQLSLRLHEAFGVNIELKELLTARTPAEQARLLENAIEADIAQQS